MDDASSGSSEVTIRAIPFLSSAETILLLLTSFSPLTLYSIVKSKSILSAN